MMMCDTTNGNICVIAASPDAGVGDGALDGGKADGGGAGKDTGAEDVGGASGSDASRTMDQGAKGGFVAGGGLSFGCTAAPDPRRDPLDLIVLVSPLLIVVFRKRSSRRR
jgi:hypothetical protein